jgi:hypothetical protein
MRSNRQYILSALVIPALLALPASAGAQIGMSVWAGVGASTNDGKVTFDKDAKQLGLQVALPVIPVALRGDALLFGNDFDTDALSYNVNAVVQMRLPVVTPYGIIGQGRYATAPGQKVSGWNVGAGLRLGLGRFGVFGEVRRHDAIDRTVKMIGLTF